MICVHRSFPTLLSVTAAVALLATQGAAAQPPAAASARDGIVFVGSSIFHRWTNLTTQMAPLPVMNRAFDGAQTDDMLRGFESFVLPYHPKVIVYYCGSNDVDGGDPAAEIFDRIRQFVARVGLTLPQARMIFVSINRAPEKKDRWDVVDMVNHQVEAYAATTPHLEYVDVNPILFNRNGTPRTELYMSDQLHLRAQAYEEFARVLKPVLTKALGMPAPNR
jgi:lysophospholipase L1-like esterase